VDELVQCMKIITSNATQHVKADLKAVNDTYIPDLRIVVRNQVAQAINDKESSDLSFYVDREDALTALAQVLQAIHTQRSGPPPWQRVPLPASLAAPGCGKSYFLKIIGERIHLQETLKRENSNVLAQSLENMCFVAVTFNDYTDVDDIKSGPHGDVEHFLCLRIIHS
jgi:hypothetical protein